MVLICYIIPLQRKRFDMKISRKKIILFITLFFLFISLLFVAIYLKNVAAYKKAVKETTFGGVDISAIPDGIYTGEYNVDFIYAKVNVTIQNKEIIAIDILEHKNERGKPAETIINKIITEQKIDVDTISGATNSSTVIKKAVENALKQTL